MSDSNVENEFETTYSKLKELLEVAVKNDENFVIYNGELVSVSEFQNVVNAFESLATGITMQNVLKLILHKEVLSDCIIRPAVLDGNLIECLCIKNKEGSESPILLLINPEIFKLITPI